MEEDLDLLLCSTNLARLDKFSSCGRALYSGVLAANAVVAVVLGFQDFLLKHRKCHSELTKLYQTQLSIWIGKTLLFDVTCF